MKKKQKEKLQIHKLEKLKTANISCLMENDSSNYVITQIVANLFCFAGLIY